MRLAIIDCATGKIRAIIEPEVQLTPFVARADEALVLVDSFPEVARVGSTELVDGYAFDLADQRFVPKTE